MHDCALPGTIGAIVGDIARSACVFLPMAGLLAGCGSLRFEEVWAEEDGALVSVWGASPEAVFAVGGQPEAGAAWRGAEAEWAPIAIPEVGLLDWVHGTGALDVWFGGIDGTLLHLGAEGVTDHSLDAEEAVWGVLALTPDEVYAVGGHSAFGGEGARAWRYDGSAWRAIALPAAAADARSLFKAALVGEQVWLVGAEGLALVGRGDAFELVPTGTAEDLVTVTAVDGRALIVGGRATGSVFTGDAAGLERLAQTPSGLFGVSDLGDGRALIAGVRGYLATVDLHTGALDVLDTPNELLFHAVWSSPGAHAYAVGGNLETATGPYRGTLLVARAPGASP